MKSAFTIVLFNERSGFLEVMHRFVLHDAEEAAWKLFDSKADIIADDKTQASFSDYAIKRFTIKDQNDKVLPLSLVGFQNDEGYFWVYQDMKLPSDVTSLNIRQDALRDIWSEQMNIVNVEAQGKTWSLTFSNSDEWRSVQLESKE
jgi:hypothetical protein